MGVYPTISTAWLTWAFGEHVYTPDEYFYHPVALTAPTIGPSCSIVIIVLSLTLYLDILVLFDILMRSLVEHRPRLFELGLYENCDA